MSGDLERVIIIFLKQAAVIMKYLALSKIMFWEGKEVVRRMELDIEKEEKRVRQGIG